MFSYCFCLVSNAAASSSSVIECNDGSTITDGDRICNSFSCPSCPSAWPLADPIDLRLMDSHSFDSWRSSMSICRERLIPEVALGITSDSCGSKGALTDTNPICPPLPRKELVSARSAVESAVHTETAVDGWAKSRVLFSSATEGIVRSSRLNDGLKTSPLQKQLMQMI
jgi:hypothetical protein